MKKINKQVKLTYLLVFNLIMFVVLFILYNYLKNLVESSSYDINIVFSGIIIVFMLIGISIFALSLLTYMFLKKQNDRLVEDLEHLSEHIQDISDKEYESKVKIKYYSDFLQISLALKNIVKRLNK